MKLNLNCPLSEKQIEKYESFIERIKGPIKDSKIPDLYCVLLQASFELSENVNFFSIKPLERFTGKIISKILNEGWAIIGCFERGAFLSNYHHTRAALELIASYYWVTYKKHKIEKRVKNFFEFDELFYYQLYLKYNESPDAANMPFLSYFTIERIELLKNKTSEWIDIYQPEGNDLLKILNWHHDACIDNILCAFPDKILKMFYDEFSHATHFSPLSHLLGTGDTVLGFSISLDGDLSELNKPLTIYLDYYEKFLSFVKNATGFDSKVKFPRY